MFTTRPEIQGTFGVVTSTHWLASAVGMAVLEKGGNAFDAAVATGFTLQIVEPHLNGPGGDLPIMLHDAKKNDTRVICAQGPSPDAASFSAFAELDLEIIPGSGLLAAVVPGAFGGWMTLLRDYGTLSLSDVMGYAIGYAKNGYPVVPRITATINTVRDLFETEWTTSAETYLPDGEPPAPGSIFRNVKLADTYERIVAEAEAGGGSRESQIDRAYDIWYRGWVADAIDSFCRTQAVMDVTGRRHKGLLSGGDLAKWSPTYETPVSYDYKNYTVCKCGPWSQGPALLQQLALLDGLGIEDTDPVGPEFVHLAVEAIKLAFADREAFYGDPDFVDVPMDVLLSKDYNDARRKLITETASMDLRPGTIDGKTLDLARLADLQRTVGGDAEALGVGEPTVSRSGEARGDTVHFDIIDNQGNMVNATPSGGWLQSSPIIPDLGFCLGNRAQMFWLDDASPSALAPNKRPRTTLSPSFVKRDGEAYMPFGTPGGDQQDQWQTLMFLHHADHGMNLQESIDAPAFHTDHFPSSFWPREAKLGRVVLEGRFADETVRDLTDRGHKIEVSDEWSEGRLTGAAKDGDLLKAAANPRGMQGYAIGR